MMHVSYPILFLICLGCLSLGGCIGMVIMALCRVSACESCKEERSQTE